MMSFSRSSRQRMFAVLWPASQYRIPPRSLCTNEWGFMQSGHFVRSVASLIDIGMCCGCRGSLRGLDARPFPHAHRTHHLHHGERCPSSPAHRPYLASLTLLADRVIQLPLALLLEQVVQHLPLRVRLLLDDAVIHLESAFYGG